MNFKILNSAFVASWWYWYLPLPVRFSRETRPPRSFWFCLLPSSWFVRGVVHHGPLLELYWRQVPFLSCWLSLSLPLLVAQNAIHAEIYQLIIITRLYSILMHRCTSYSYTVTQYTYTVSYFTTNLKVEAKNKPWGRAFLSRWSSLSSVFRYLARWIARNPSKKIPVLLVLGCPGIF